MPQRTPLYQAHLDADATMVDFAGWQMPIHYGSQLTEHYAVRQSAGMFDVSHMTVLDLTGDGARDFLRYLLANDVARLSLNKALYSCMLNHEGGIIDDLIVYYLSDSPSRYRMVVNAATRDKDIAWIRKQANEFAVTINECHDLAMLAVQGPTACDTVATVLPTALAQAMQNLKRFQAYQQHDWFIARTGYTGEDGVEIIIPATEATKLWQRLLAAGVTPCGLGARDTLRLEAGMHLYGTDMDETVTPLVSGLAWTIAWEPADHDFIGKQALLAQKATGVDQRFVGLVLETKGVLRNHQRVVCEGVGDGEITSGSFSPSLQCAIGLARIPAAATDAHCQVEIRGRLLPARIVKLPFVSQGECVLVD